MRQWFPKRDWLIQPRQRHPKQVWPHLRRQSVRACPQSPARCRPAHKPKHKVQHRHSPRSNAGLRAQHWPPAWGQVKSWSPAIQPHLRCAVGIKRPQPKTQQMQPYPRIKPMKGLWNKLRLRRLKLRNPMARRLIFMPVMGSVRTASQNCLSFY